MPELHATTASTEETLAWGATLAAALVDVAPAGFVLDLRGDLGAGKTVFVRGLARALGVPPSIPVVSPTFTIARAYVLAERPWEALHHLDAYRLSGEDELEGIGFEDMCGSGRLTCVEWGENVAAALPEDRLIITLTHGPVAALRPGDAPEGTRALRLEASGPQGMAVLARLAAATGASAGASS